MADQAQILPGTLDLLIFNATPRMPENNRQEPEGWNRPAEAVTCALAAQREAI